MGVPGFVAWLRDYFKDIMIYNSLPSDPDVLYIDGNCLIHPKCFEILDNCPDIESHEKLEGLMFRRITKFIDYLVDYVSPKKECYFAVDGVAPLAKINQQRKRRFRAIDDAEMKDQLKQKYNLPLPTKWTNTVITPGTDFMEKLHNYLHKYFKTKAANCKKGITYRYSSYHTSGEGEHKILKDIRTLLRTKQSKDDDTYVIYGLDADLFFLSMASMKKNIYLLREEFHFVQGKAVKRELFDPIDDVAEEMRYVSIDITKECYDKRISEIIMQKREPTYRFTESDLSTEYWDDFVFICYFLGNDFLPHLPSIDIHKEGLDIVIDCYTDIMITLNQKLIIPGEKTKINTIFLLELLRKLSDMEELYFSEMLPEFNHKRGKRRCFAQDEYSRELWSIENMKFHVDDNIQLGTGSKEDWQFRYYSHYFGVSEYYQEHVDSMAKLYAEGLMWVLKYYFEECPSYTWLYPFTHAPFISDIYKYLNESKLDVNDIMFSMQKPLTPCVQLLSVLPPACSNLLPKKYTHLVTSAKSPILDLYPTKVPLDMINKDMYYMCVPMLPYLDVNRILHAVKDIKLTEQDTLRNKETEDYIFHPRLKT
ncbi:MAG: XRN 5'-3' exonuclease [Harvfovirus sp.]|uniref:XRN 5'-3' exonuclease n=1 Tax=Harvfovirus sp. TaxID=2487768 RepID=A0A3G5A0U8_9VIRU|nr:MAG: XRN 5'-3' exonuclease [Harvfovirus sp.]